MTELLQALADMARAATLAIRAAVKALRAALRRTEERRRSLTRRRDALAMVPVDPVWPGKCYADGTPVDCRVTVRPYRREPHIRVRYGDIPDQYGNYPY